MRLPPRIAARGPRTPPPRNPPPPPPRGPPRRPRATGNQDPDHDEQRDFWQALRHTFAIDREQVVVTLAGVGLFTLAKRLLFDFYHIPSGSMLPTLAIGDFVLVDKRHPSLGGRSFHRNDIVVFHPPSVVAEPEFQDKVFLKRIVAIPGDTVEVRRGTLLVNRVPQREPFLAERPTYKLSRLIVPPNHVLVLGDNRNASYDSHIYGPIQLDQIVGRVSSIYWPPNRWRTV